MHDQELRQYLFGMGLPIPAVGGNIFFVAEPTTKAWDWMTSRVKTHQLCDSTTQALSRCVDYQNDTVVILPYHTEAISAADQVNFNKAGVDVFGLGRGSGIPKFDFTNAAGELIVSAPDVRLKNIRLHANVPDVLLGLTLEATALGCELGGIVGSVETTGTDEFATTIEVIAAANGALIENCSIDNGLGNAVQAIHLNGASANQQILKNFITGDYSTANIAGSTTASTVLKIGHNILQNGTGTDINTEPNIELNGNSTGIIYNNYCACNLATKAASIVAAACFLFENYYNEDISGAATGGIIGTASADG